MEERNRRRKGIGGGNDAKPVSMLYLRRSVYTMYLVLVFSCAYSACSITNFCIQNARENDIVLCQGET